MTENENPSPASVENETPAAKPTCACGTKHYGRCALGVLVVVLAVGAATCPWLRDKTGAEVTVPVAGGTAAIEQRLAALEARPVAEAAPAQEAASAADIAAIKDAVKSLEARLAQQENRAAQDQRGIMQMMSATMAYVELRDAIKEGRAFAPALVALHAALAGNAAAEELASKLDGYAAQGVPTLAQLRVQLTDLEKTETPAPAATGETPDWWARFIKITRPLIAVRPLHNGQYVALEKALEANDGAAALEAAKALPPEAQKNGAAWQAALEARVAVDALMPRLAASFSSIAPVTGQGAGQ